MWKCINCDEQDNEDTYRFCFVCGTAKPDLSGPQDDTDDIARAFGEFSRSDPPADSESAAVDLANEGRENRFSRSLSHFGDRIKHVIHAGNGSLKHVKVSADAQEKLAKLVSAGVFDSQADAASFLIDEGIKSQAPLFKIVEQKLSEIERLRGELRHLVNRENT